MLSIFKKKDVKNTRGLSYYDRVSLVHNLNDLISVTNPESAQQHTTSKIIKYNGVALSEITEEKVMDMFDKPDFVIDEVETQKDYKVMFYRHTVDKFNFLLQFHFYKSHFFFVSNTISTAGPLSNADTEKLIHRLATKYGLDLKRDARKNYDIKITDKSNNIIKIIDEVSFKMNYINNSATNQQLMNNPDFFSIEPEEDTEAQIDDYI